MFKPPNTLAYLGIGRERGNNRAVTVLFLVRAAHDLPLAIIGLRASKPDRLTDATSLTWRNFVLKMWPLDTAPAGAPIDMLKTSETTRRLESAWKRALLGITPILDVEPTEANAALYSAALTRIAQLEDFLSAAPPHSGSAPTNPVASTSDGGSHAA